MAAYQSEERVTYQKLKELALDAYFDFCRDTGLASRGGHEQVMARLDYTFEEGFERPIEDLMWRVVLLILSCGLHPEWEAQQRVLILGRLATRDAHSLMVGVPKEESDLFLHDLSLLGLI